MIVKNIQQRSNVRCRMCEEEIGTIVNEEIPWPINATDNTWIERKKRYDIRLKELREERKTTCYGLEGTTASGNSLEAICEKHLIELRKQISDFLGALHA
jgi:hypothetical protein